jgi:apolipoprotein N-acyltransferase
MARVIDLAATPRLDSLTYAASIGSGKLASMNDAVSTSPGTSQQLVAVQPAIEIGSNPSRLQKTILSSRDRSRTAVIADSGLAVLCALLLALSFPDFNLWPLAWIGLVPLLILIERRPAPIRAAMFGWLAGTVFFYTTCYWLTYSMIHYGGIRAPLAYLLLIPGAAIVGLFPAVFALALAHVVRRWGARAMLIAPLVWVSLEWARLSITGQLWNAIGYSQAYHPALIQTGRWGGVYAVGFLIVTVNAAVAVALLERSGKAALMTSIAICGAVSLIVISEPISSTNDSATSLAVVALQPNVPMEPVKSAEDLQELTSRHLLMSERALNETKSNATRLVVWPESPMNFNYGEDSQFRDLVDRFALDHRALVLFNSQEPAQGGGYYNSALLVNEEGRLVAQYDKIRLMPFGEYVPLPHWLPGSNRIRALVGEFTAGTRYTLMPIGRKRAGVFICIESAYPSIARTFAAEGADVLINISNDGYLGPTAVLRQHLANAIFRAVENDRPLLRVTNAGITAFITANGEVKDATQGFQTAVRNWEIRDPTHAQTFYTKHGDLFVGICSALSLLMIGLSFRVKKRSIFRRSLQN